MTSTIPPQLQSPQAAANSNGASAPVPVSTVWTVGQLVSVESRTWPGINQPGGVGRITGLSTAAVSVKYVIDGRHEKEIATKYVRPHSMSQGQQFRDRSMLLGRCSNCGSLRADCGSCDVWVTQQQQQKQVQLNQSSSRRRRPPAIHVQSSLEMVAASDDDRSSDEDSIDLEALATKYRRDFQRYKRHQAKATAALKAAHVYSSSDESRNSTPYVKGSTNKQSLPDVAKEENSSSPEDTTSSDESNNARLHELACSQLIVSPSRTNGRGVWSIARQDNARLRMIRRGRRAILESSCSEEEDDRMEQPPSRRREQGASSPHISNPGSPDFNHVGAVAWTTKTASRATQGPSPTRQSRAGNVAKESIDFSADYDNVYDDFMNVEIDADGFIQPEGNADALPVDMRDTTAGLEYPELAPLFDKVIQRLETQDIPALKLSVIDLERRWNDFEPCHNGSGATLERESQTLLDEIIRKLVRGGVDQCQRALRKLTSKRCYTRYKTANGDSTSPLTPFVAHDTREFRLDSVGRAVEDLVARIRMLSGSLLSESDDNGSVGSDESDGWAEPASQSPLKEAFHSQNPLDDTHIGMERDDKHFDAHPYANKKRKLRTPDARKRAKAKRRKGQKRVSSKGSSGLAEVPSGLNHFDKSKDLRDSQPNAPVGERGERQKVSSYRRNDRGNRAFNELFGADPVTGECGIGGVPDIENILPGEALHARQRIGHTLDREAIGDRMHRWLNVNEGLSLSARDNGKSGHAKRPTQSGPHPDPTAISTKSTENQLIRREQLISPLYRKRFASPIEETPVNPRTESSVHDLCDALAGAESNGSTCRKIVNDICCKWTGPHSQSREDASAVFQALLAILQLQDCRALQAFISCDSAVLDKFIMVLVATIRLIDLDVNKDLTPLDGVVFRIFGQGHCHVFVDFVILQMVDSVMSLVHPTAWNIQVLDRSKLLGKLEPLRNALAKRTELVETVSRCIARDLGHQEWRCARGGDVVYVSSVDPASWRSLLLSGSETKSGGCSRFSAFAHCFPRCEIEAIWCVLAYFSQTAILSHGSGTFRWQFVASLLTRGSIAPTVNSTLAPCKEQIEAASADLTSLTDLILTDSMGDLPRRDKILLDLLQKALSLQSDDIFLNEQTRMAFHPVVEDVKRDKRFLGNVQRTIRGDAELDSRSRSAADFARALCQAEGSLRWMGQPLLLPSSRILQRCLGLLVAWAGRIPPDNGPRRHCFSNVVKALVVNLTTPNKDMGSSSGSGPIGTQQSQNLFQDAFSSVGVVPDMGGQPENRRTLFRSESAAYLAMCSTIAFEERTDKPDDSQSLGERVWHVVSDDEMRNRQLWVATNCKSGRPLQVFHGDGLQLYIAAKAISFLALSLLGVDPSSGHLFVIPNETEPRIQCDSAVITYLLSCIVACLDSACESHLRTEILSSVASCFSVVLAALLSARVKANVRSCVRMVSTTNVLQRVFCKLTNASFCDVEEDLCFQGLITIFRQLVMIVPNEEPTGMLASSAQDSAQSPNEFDDLFRGIDDDVLASMDLGGDDTESREDPLLLIYTLLVNALDRSKPSSRYSVNEDSGLTVQGMKLINKRSDIVCRCVADIVAARWRPDLSTKQLWYLPIRFSLHDDQGDTKYHKILALFLTRQLCGRHSRRISEVARHGDEELLFNLLEGLLDTKLLSKVPSCNLRRIEATSGSIGEERGFTELMSYEKGQPRTLCSAMDDLRNFSGDMGRLLAYKDDSSPDHAFAAQALFQFHRSSRKASQMKLSLEKECFDRFILLRDVLCASEKQSTKGAERLSALLLASCSSELRRLIEVSAIHVNARRDIQQDCYDVAKESEAVSCFAELYLSLMAIIFGCLSNRPSDRFSDLILRVCERFISPLLRRQNFSLLACLNDIVYLSTKVLAGEGRLVRQTASHSHPTKFDLTPYCDKLRHCLIFRCKEFLLAVAACSVTIPKLRSTGIFSAFVAAGTSDKNFAVRVGRSFSTSETSDNSEYLSPVSEATSPLHNAIDLDFSRRASREPHLAEHAKAILTLKQQALRGILIPKLASDRAHDSATRTGTLYLIQQLLDIEHGEKALQLHSPRIDALLLCSLAKGIGACVRVALVHATTVDETLLKAAFTCARSLINIPAACVESGAVGWVVDWACSSLDSANSHQKDPVTSQARYLWCCSLWLKGVADILLDGSSAATVDLIRLQLLENERKPACDKIIWPQHEGSLSAITVSLVDLEKQVFPVPSHSTVTNVYAVRRRTPIEGPLERWIPSLEVRSIIGQFSTKVHYATPVRNEKVLLN